MDSRIWHGPLAVKLKLYLNEWKRKQAAKLELPKVVMFLLTQVVIKVALNLFPKIGSNMIKQGADLYWSADNSYLY